MKGKSSFKNRLFLLFLFPSLVTGVAVTYYLTATRINDMNESLVSRSENTLSHIADAAEYGIFSENRTFLYELIEAFLSEEIVYVNISNLQGETLAEAGTAEKQSANPDFEKIIHESGISISDDMTLQNNSQTSPVGKVTIQVNRDYIKSEINEAIIVAIIIILILVSIILIAINVISREFIHPLLKLDDAANKLKSGVFELVDTDRNDELGNLSRTFNDMARAINFSRSKLEDQVRIATETLMNNIENLRVKNIELESAREEAVQAGNAKTEFLARMSHEMRSPVNALSGFAKLLYRNAENQQQMEYAKNMIDASNNLVEVIDDILGAVKIQSGRFDNRYQDINLGYFLEKIVAQYSPGAHKKKIPLSLILPHNSDTVILTDPVKLKRILTNIISNSIKFTSEGNVSIQATLDRNDENERANLKIVVRDTGIGIDSEEKEKIFQPFYQIDQSITRNFQGTGLGLAISGQFISDLDGSIDLNSQPEKGSKFTINIPVDIVRENPEPEPLNISVAVYENNQGLNRAIKNSVLQWSRHFYSYHNPDDLEALSGNNRPEKIDLFILGLDFDEKINQILWEKVTTMIKDSPDMTLLVLTNSEFVSLPEEISDNERIHITGKPVSRKKLYEIASECREKSTPAHRETILLASSENEKHDFNILVAEDNEFNIELIRAILEEHNYSCTIAEDGLKALELAGSEIFDLVITDIHLPGLDGVSLAKKIKQETSNSNTPVISLTADVFAYEKNLDHVHAIDHWLTKPVDEEKLVSLISAYSGKKYLSSSSESILQKKRNLLPAVISALDTHLDRIKSHSARSDLDAISSEAHHISGLCGYYGMEKTGELSRTIEQACKDRLPNDEIERMIHYLDKTARTIIDSVRNEETSS